MVVERGDDPIEGHGAAVVDDEHLDAVPRIVELGERREASRQLVVTTVRCNDDRERGQTNYRLFHSTRQARQVDRS